jgi:hypothetical protein
MIPSWKACAASLAIALAQPGCERHSASETVPGYAEKLAEKSVDERAQASTAEAITLNPPRFFPPGKSNAPRTEKGN